VEEEEEALALAFHASEPALHQLSQTETQLISDLSYVYTAPEERETTTAPFGRTKMDEI
jgi:hypothetical protein